MSDALEPISETPVQYESYLLRIWRTAAGGSRRWMLEQVVTGERHTFTNLPDLVLFLRDQAGAARSGPRHRVRGIARAAAPFADSREEQA
jgi:hypothetical protein